MESKLISHIDQFLADSPYYAAMFLVQPKMAKLREAAVLIHQHYNWPHLSLNHKLSDALQNMPPEKRQLEIPHILTEMIYNHGDGPLLCTDITLLFEPDFQLDPLQLFLTASKTTCLIISWPGSYQNKRLAYAVPDHAHYRVWTTSDLCHYCTLFL